MAARAKAAVPRLLWITDRHACRGRTLAEVCRAFLDGAQAAGAPCGILLREKDLDGSEQYAHARALRGITAEHGATLLVSGRVDVAIAADADGVHLPQNDLPPAVARELLGARLLGVSCHSAAEADAAIAAGADYISFGPVFDTPSKRAYGSPVGLEALAAVTAAESVPVLALGGITTRNGAAVIDAGAHGIACIAAIAAADDPTAVAAELAALLAHHAGV